MPETQQKEIAPYSREHGGSRMPYPLGVNENGIIEPRPIDPTETFVNADDSGLSENGILDYWGWAFSGLVGYAERGVLAEYLF